MNSREIERKLKTDPRFFREHLRIDADGQALRLGDCIENFQQRDFLATDDAWKRIAGQTDIEPQFQRAWLERSRGHSKTSDQATMAAWALFASPRKLSGVAVAADKDQAGLLRDAIERLVRLNSWLGILDVQRDRVINRVTGSELVTISSDVASSYGLISDFILLDEICHWQNIGLWESLLSTAAKKPSCLLIVLTNAGFQDSWQWKLRESVKQRSDWYFSRLERPEASWISAEILAEQKALLPAIAYRRLWLNEWGDGEGDALNPDDIESAISMSRPLRAPEKGWIYTGGMDLSLRHDSSAFCVIGKHVGYTKRTQTRPKPIRSSAMRCLQDLGFLDAPRQPESEVEFFPGSGKLKLAALKIWTPQNKKTLDLNLIQNEVRDISKRFKLSSLGYDEYQGALMSQNLRRAGVRTNPITSSGRNLQNMATELLNSFQDKNFEMFRDETLLADLKKLRVIEKSYGFRIDAARTNQGQGTRHADTCSALQLALLEAKNLRIDQNQFDQRELIYYNPAG